MIENVTKINVILISVLCFLHCFGSFVGGFFVHHRIVDGNHICPLMSHKIAAIVNDAHHAGAWIRHIHDVLDVDVVDARPTSRMRE